MSLRDNPLVTRFVNSCARELMYNSPTLLELAARVIKLKKIQYTNEDLPQTLITYLSSGQRCVNPKCKGMFSRACVLKKLKHSIENVGMSLFNRVNWLKKIIILGWYFSVHFVDFIYEYSYLVNYSTFIMIRFHMLYKVISH